MTFVHYSDDMVHADAGGFAFSQPLQYHGGMSTQDLSQGVIHGTSFSQPENEYLTPVCQKGNSYYPLTSSSLLLRQTQCQGNLLPGARLTRLYCRHPIAEIIAAVHSVLEDFIVPHKVHHEKMVGGCCTHECLSFINYIANYPKDHIQHGG